MAPLSGWNPRIGEDRTLSSEHDQSVEASEHASTSDAGDDVAARTVARLRRKLADQAQRIEALGRGREESLALIGELRAELDLVTAERDQLQQRLAEVEGMQTETLAIDDSDIDDQLEAGEQGLPSIDELLATFTGDGRDGRPSHSTQPVDDEAFDETGDLGEMISPDLLVLGPEGKQRGSFTDERCLVLLEPDNHTQWPLDGDLLTIGRSASADILVNGDFISRIHARVLRIGMDSVIEDAGSRNGTWVNGEQVARRALVHGDLVRIGSVNFRYIDSAQARVRR